MIVFTRPRTRPQRHVEQRGETIVRRVRGGLSSFSGFGYEGECLRNLRLLVCFNAGFTSSSSKDCQSCCGVRVSMVIFVSEFLDTLDPERAICDYGYNPSGVCASFLAKQCD